MALDAPIHPYPLPSPWDCRALDSRHQPLPVVAAFAFATSPQPLKIVIFSIAQSSHRGAPPSFVLTP
jgi:hypothetical protein